MRAWADLAARQQGVITYGQLRGAGISRTTVHRMAERRELLRQTKGVYLVHGAPLNYATRLWCTVLATGGVLGFATAAHLWGLIDAPPSSEITHRSRPRSARRSRELVVTVPPCFRNWRR